MIIFPVIPSYIFENTRPPIMSSRTFPEQQVAHCIYSHSMAGLLRRYAIFISIASLISLIFVRDLMCSVSICMRGIGSPQYL